MSIYRFLNVYESMRLGGLKNAFGNPKIVYPENLNVLERNKDIILTNKEYKKLKLELEKKGNGYIKTIVEYRGNFIIGLKKEKILSPQQIQLYEKDADEFYSAKVNFINDVKNELLEKVQNKEITKNQVFSLFDQELKGTTKDYELKIGKLKAEIQKYRTGENLSVMAVQSYKDTFNLFTKNEMIETTNVIIEQNEKENFILMERQREEEEKKLAEERKKYEKELAENRKMMQQKEIKIQQEMVQVNKNIPILASKLQGTSTKFDYGAIYFGNMGIPQTKYSEYFSDIKEHLKNIVSVNSLNKINDYDIMKGENPIVVDDIYGKKIAIVIKKYR